MAAATIVQLAKSAERLVVSVKLSASNASAHKSHMETLSTTIDHLTDPLSAAKDTGKTMPDQDDDATASLEYALKRSLDVLKRADVFVKKRGKKRGLARIFGGGKPHPADVVSEELSALEADLLALGNEINGAIGYIMDPGSDKRLARKAEAVVVSPAVHEPELGEDRTQCVQCSAFFLESENHARACTFHAQPIDGWNHVWPCCGATDRMGGRLRSLPGCQTRRHRPAHHADYPYAAYAEWAWTERDTQTRERWGELTCSATVQGEPAQHTRLGIRADGALFLYHYDTATYYLRIGDNDLEAWETDKKRPPTWEWDGYVEGQGAWYTRGEFLREERKITGFQFTTKSIKDPPATLRLIFTRLPFELMEMETKGVEGADMTGGGPGARPDYHLVGDWSQARSFPSSLFDDPPEEPQLLAIPDPGLDLDIRRLRATVAMEIGGERDSFIVSLMFLSSAPEPITLVSATAWIRPALEAGDHTEEEWNEMSEPLKFMGEGSVAKSWPIVIPTKKTARADLRATFDAPGRPQKNFYFQRRSWLARDTPVDIKILFTTDTGATVTLPVTFANPKAVWESAAERDMTKHLVWQVSLDDTESWTRYFLCAVNKGALALEDEGLTFWINDGGDGSHGRYYTQAQLAAAVKTAEAEDTDRVPMGSPDPDRVKLTLLIDRAAGIVYAVEVDMTTATGHLLTYFHWPGAYIGGVDAPEDVRTLNALSALPPPPDAKPVRLSMASLTSINTGGSMHDDDGGMTDVSVASTASGRKRRRKVKRKSGKKSKSSSSLDQTEESSPIDVNADDRAASPEPELSVDGSESISTTEMGSVDAVSLAPPPESPDGAEDAPSVGDFDDP